MKSFASQKYFNPKRFKCETCQTLCQKVITLNQKLNDSEYFSNKKTSDERDLEIFNALKPVEFVMQEFKNSKIQKWFKNMQNVEAMQHLKLESKK